MRDTIDMAREAGWPIEAGNELPDTGGMCFKTFEALVRADQDEKYKWDIHSCGPTCKRYACVAMREAVEAEREACAKVADYYSMHDQDTPADIAEAIRNRENT
jgi:hypothetical protein